MQGYINSFNDRQVDKENSTPIKNDKLLINGVGQKVVRMDA